MFFDKYFRENFMCVNVWLVIKFVISVIGDWCVVSDVFIEFVKIKLLLELNLDCL